MLEHATRLFAEKGFAGTSLQDVAESMGLKRPALYYYFKSKDDLLDRLIADATTGPALELKVIAERADLDATQRLHAIARSSVAWIVTHTDRFLLLVKSESELSPANLKKFNAGRRDAVDIVRAVIDDGIKSGQFRPVDSRVATFGVFGICNWVAWWYQPGGRESVESIADQLADMVVAGLQRPEQRGQNVLNPRSAVAALRENLDRLEQALNISR